MSKDKQVKSKTDKKPKGNPNTNRNNPPESSNFQDFYNEVKNNKWNYGIIFFLTFLVIMTMYLQYKSELHQRNVRSSDGEDEGNYYEVLGLENGAAISNVKKQYRELAKIWYL